MQENIVDTFSGGGINRNEPQTLLYFGLFHVLHENYCKQIIFIKS